VRLAPVVLCLNRNHINGTRPLSDTNWDICY